MAQKSAVWSGRICIKLAVAKQRASSALKSWASRPHWWSDVRPKTSSGDAAYSKRVTAKREERQPKLISGHRPVSVTRADKINKMMGKFTTYNMLWNVWMSQRLWSRQRFWSLLLLLMLLLSLKMVISAYSTRKQFFFKMVFLEPQYKVPRHQTMTKILQHTQNDLKAEVKINISNSAMKSRILKTLCHR